MALTEKMEICSAIVDGKTTKKQQFQQVMQKNCIQPQVLGWGKKILKLLSILKC
ncbi:hypothetical protein ACKUV4_015420 [Acinetobacter baumannii]